MALSRAEFVGRDGAASAVEWWAERAGLHFYVTEQVPGAWGNQWRFVLGYRAGAVRLPCPKCGDDHPHTEACPDPFAR